MGTHAGVLAVATFPLAQGGLCGGASPQRRVESVGPLRRAIGLPARHRAGGRRVYGGRGEPGGRTRRGVTRRCLTRADGGRLGRERPASGIVEGDGGTSRDDDRIVPARRGDGRARGRLDGGVVKGGRPVRGILDAERRGSLTLLRVARVAKDRERVLALGGRGGCGVRVACGSVRERTDGPVGQGARLSAFFSRRGRFRFRVCGHPLDGLDRRWLRPSGVPGFFGRRGRLLASGRTRGLRPRLRMGRVRFLVSRLGGGASKRGRLRHPRIGLGRAGLVARARGLSRRPRRGRPARRLPHLSGDCERQSRDFADGFLDLGRTRAAREGGDHGVNREEEDHGGSVDCALTPTSDQATRLMDFRCSRTSFQRPRSMSASRPALRAAGTPVSPPCSAGGSGPRGAGAPPLSGGDCRTGSADCAVACGRTGSDAVPPRSGARPSGPAEASSGAVGVGAGDDQSGPPPQAGRL